MANLAGLIDQRMDAAVTVLAAGGGIPEPTVHAPAEPGGPARVEADYGVHLYDRYNWDLEPGNQAEIAGIPLPDEKFGPLHRAGLAQEYDIKGIPGTRRGRVPQAG